jgi:hypothetical protein
MNFSKSIYPILTNNWVKMCSIVKEFGLKSKNFSETCSIDRELFFGTGEVCLIKSKSRKQFREFYRYSKSNTNKIEGIHL